MSKMVAKKKSVGWSARSFVEETKSELNKVEWPTRDHATHAFVTVMIIVIGFTSYVALSDAVLSRILMLLRSL